jgi:hypothetical protein
VINSNQISLEAKATQFIRQSLIENPMKNPFNVVLRSKAKDNIQLEQDIKHLYNKTSYKISKSFRACPVFSLVGFIEKGECTGLHAHLLIEPPEIGLIEEPSFKCLLNSVWITTHFGTEISYIQNCQSWIGSVFYNSKSRTKLTNPSSAFVHFGKPYWL